MKLKIDKFLNKVREKDSSTSGWDISGSGTANEIAYFTAEKTIDNLPVATYPSLAELAYVKWVTSAIQTQINGKQATMSKATGAEVNTGTDDAKFVTAKAMEDSSYGKNPMTTAWDVIYGGTSWVPTRLPIGTAGQVLKVNTWATGVEWWAGGDSSSFLATQIFF